MEENQIQDVRRILNLNIQPIALTDITAADIGKQFIFVADYGAGHGRVIRCTYENNEYGNLSFMYHTQEVAADGTRIKYPLRNPQAPVYKIFRPEDIKQAELTRLRALKTLPIPSDTARHAFSFGGKSKRKNKKNKKSKKK
jgi:hypothetical protein